MNQETYTANLILGDTTVSIVAQGPARSLHVARADFIDLLRQHPDGAIAIAVLVSHRLGALFQYVDRSQGRSLDSSPRCARGKAARNSLQTLTSRKHHDHSHIDLEHQQRP